MKSTAVIKLLYIVLILVACAVALAYRPISVIFVGPGAIALSFIVL